MKKILLCLALFCLATGPISCGDSNTDDGTEQGGGGNGGGTGPEPEPGNPEITPEQHKAKLETIGKEVAAQFNPEDSKAAIESLTALEELSVVGKSNVSADGLTLAPEVTVTLNGGYVAAAKVNADPKQVTANASFTKNGTQIVDAYAKMVCDGLTDPDNWIVEEEYDWNGDGVIDDTYTYIDPEDHIVDHVKTGEGYVTVMGLKLTLSGDIAKIIQQVNAIADTSTATGSQQEADAYNTNAKAKLAYTADNSTMADVKMQSYSYKDYIYVWNPDTQTGDNQVVTRYDIEPVLEFADGSKIAIEEYVETGFDSLTKTFEDLADAYMDLIDGK